MHLAVRTLAKISQGWLFIESLLQMLKTSDFDRDGYRKFIVQFPYQKAKIVLSVRIILEKMCLLKVGNIVSDPLLRQSLDSP